MPSSSSESIPYEIEFIRKNQPNLSAVLDVGIGFGKGAFLIHEYFDVKERQLYKPDKWKVEITGIEVFPSYLSELQQLLYSKIIIGDVFDVLPTLGRFDVAILGDVLEHFSKDKGYALIDDLFNHVTDIVIATPNGFLEHKATENKYEAHLSGWVHDDFTRYKIMDYAVISRIRKKEEVLVIYLRKT